MYIDTGAMYRAVTYYIIQQKVDFEDENAVKAAIQNIEIEFIKDEVQFKQLTFLNKKNIDAEIRTMAVNQFVSEVSKVKAVRDFLKIEQQQMGLNKGIVMDGRDIGTVVFPNAALKLFVTANTTIRAKRRFYEMKEMGITCTLEEVEKNLLKRDHIDSSRAISPLKKASDAVVIDNSDLTIEQQLDIAEKLALEIIEA